jgi:hypothetical protein
MEFESGASLEWPGSAESRRRFIWLVTVTNIHPDIHPDVRAIASKERSLTVLLTGREPPGCWVKLCATSTLPIKKEKRVTPALWRYFAIAAPMYWKR